MKFTYTLIVLFFSLQSFGQLTLSPFASGIAGLVDIASCGDSRIFLVQKTGKILIADSSGNVNPVPFLSITSRVYGSTLEPGLLSLVFSPDYLQSGVFYVYYTEVGTRNNWICRYRTSANPDVADSLNEERIINVSTTSTHLGGDMAFGKDGYLYIGLGDGGGEGDPSNHAQDTALLLGKFLRLDVSDTSQAGYDIPADNPYVNGIFRDEVWSVGFRNPWRWSFDRLKHDMWIGDVGQVQREEIDFEPSLNAGGRNYGWRCYEGTLPYTTTNCGPSTDYVNPIFEYSHSFGCSVTGGFVYRGSSYHSIFGRYFYSDWCSSSIRALIVQNGLVTDTNYGALGLSSGPVCFGEDRWGDMLVGTQNGTVYRMRDPSAHHVAWIWDEDTMHVCQQPDILLQTPAGPGFHYQWTLDGNPFGNDSSAIVINSEGNYQVTVSNAFGLPQTSSVVYLEYEPLPSVNVVGLDTLYCVNDASASLLVFPIGGILTVDGNFQSSMQYDPAAAGVGLHEVSYSYTSSTGCTGSFTQQVRVDICSQVNESRMSTPFLFPNPAAEYVILPKAGNYLFCTLQGNEVMHIDSAEDNQKVDLHGLNPGFYLVRYTQGEKAGILRMVIVDR